MSTATANASTQREPELLGQTVVLIGGSAGIGLETARRARAEGAEVVLTGRNPERLEKAARDVGARSTAAFDATDAEALKRFFDGLPDPIDHVLVTGPGPRYAPLLEMDADQVRETLSDHVVLGLEVARSAASKMRAGIFSRQFRSVGGCWAATRAKASVGGPKNTRAAARKP